MQEVDPPLTGVRDAGSKQVPLPYSLFIIVEGVSRSSCLSRRKPNSNEVFVIDRGILSRTSGGFRSFFRIEIRLDNA